MIEDLVVELFEKQGHTWKLKDGYIQPEVEDVTKVLDEAARVLYDSEPGERLNLGGLIIEKTEDDHIVYAIVGRYK